MDNRTPPHQNSLPLIGRFSFHLKSLYFQQQCRPKQDFKIQQCSFKQALRDIRKTEQHFLKC